MVRGRTAGGMFDVDRGNKDGTNSGCQKLKMAGCDMVKKNQLKRWGARSRECKEEPRVDDDAEPTTAKLIRFIRVRSVAVKHSIGWGYQRRIKGLVVFPRGEASLLEEGNIRLGRSQLSHDGIGSL